MFPNDQRPFKGLVYSYGLLKGTTVFQWSFIQNSMCPYDHVEDTNGFQWPVRQPVFSCEPSEETKWYAHLPCSYNHSEGNNVFHQPFGLWFVFLLGILNLIERGLIPRAARISLEKPPVLPKPAHLHEFQAKHKKTTAASKDKEVLLTMSAKPFSIIGEELSGVHMTSVCLT